jgi:hypothetical protein
MWIARKPNEQHWIALIRSRKNAVSLTVSVDEVHDHPLVLMQEFLISSGGFLQRLNTLLRTNRCWCCLRNAGIG